MTVWLDGKIFSDNDAKVSVFDHGLLYGDGVFEGIRVYENNVFKLEEHLDRLFDSARAIALEIPLSKQQMQDAVVQTVREFGQPSAYIRLVVTRGKGDLGINPQNSPMPSVIIIVGKIRLYPAEVYENGLEIISSSVRRVSPASFNPRIKSLNYLNNILARIECFETNALEAIMLDANGFVVECTGDNLFIVKNEVIYTPPHWLGALKGITRDAVIQIAKKQGLQVAEQPFTVYEVYTADECFLTGTGAEIAPVARADKRTIGTGKPGPVFRKILEEFRKLAKIDGVRV